MTSEYDWELYPKAEAFLLNNVSLFFARNDFASNLAPKIEQQTSTHFFDWIDHITLPSETVDVEDLAKLGFKKPKEGASGDAEVYQLVGSTLFPILLKKGTQTELAINVEDIMEFQKLHAKEKTIQGKQNASFRKLTLNDKNGFVFSAVERRGSFGFDVEESRDIPEYIEACQVLGSRNRSFGSDEEGLAETENLVKDLLCARLSKGRLADAFFRAERNHWQSRNNAAQIQKGRQDKLGLGWANADHHTFRSSRKNFAALIRIFELLGLAPRERFHAGAQAGWGAQILEDAPGRTVVFADVDLAAEEREDDFAHKGLGARDTLGTVGLWVGLHGESILEAGMHHLAARFRFDDVREDLKAMGAGMMKPFSNFPFLKQTFTEPEMWQVKKERVDLLEIKRQVSQEQGANFLQNGAVGSHMENIERSEGFKGFNQNSVNAIIKLTDPRAQMEKYA